MHVYLRVVSFILLFSLLAVLPAFSSSERVRYISADVRRSVIEELIKKYGTMERARMNTCVPQVAEFWTREDGSPEEFSRFCLDYFIADRKQLSSFLSFMEQYLEVLDGNLSGIRRKAANSIFIGDPAANVPEALFAFYDPSSTFQSDMFSSKAAFSVLLNFPVLSLEEMSRKNYFWMKEFTREDWAGFRLAQRFSGRVPASAVNNLSSALIRARQYVFLSKIPVSSVLSSANSLPVSPEGRLLYSASELSDEIRLLYSSASEDALLRQQALFSVAESVALSQIQLGILKDVNVAWDPVENIYFKSGKEFVPIKQDDNRYKYLRQLFLAQKNIDRYSLYNNTFLSRTFNEEIEIPEAKVEKMLISVLESKIAGPVVNLIEADLGRSLEPYDIWYGGFDCYIPLSKDKLDRVSSEKYSDIDDFTRDIGRILLRMGFSKNSADFLSEQIVVCRSDGDVFSLPPVSKGDKSYLYVKIGNAGLSYYGYKAAVASLGYSVEQLYSLYGVDNNLLRGLPNEAFSQAFSIMFEDRCKLALGIKMRQEHSDDYRVLDTFWNLRRECAEAVHCLYLWRWMYQNPEATDDELRAASISIARDIWNKYYSAIISDSDSPVLAFNSQHISELLHIIDYPLGRIINYQLTGYMKERNAAIEIERICSIGRLTPEIWLQKAIGSDLSVDGLLQDVSKAAANINKSN